MVNICNTCSETLSKRYDKDNCKTVLRPYGSDKMIGFHCSVSFEDILDVAIAGEWDDHLTSGKILLSPFAGKFELGDSSTDVITDGCGREIPDVTKTPWTFSTPSVAEDYSDETWWRAFHLEFTNYSWGWFNCKGRLCMNDDTVQAILAELAEISPAAVPVAYPGYPLSLGVIPRFEQINGAGKAGQWKASGSFIHSHVITTVEIPGLAALISSKG